MKKMTAALAGLAAMALALSGCSNSSDDSAGAGDSDAQSFKVGVVQLVQHEALDAATQGFQDKLQELLEADGYSVEFDVQNAGGDSTNTSTIANGFVSDGVDLIMANATPALQSAVQATTEIPILGTSVTDYATALDIEDWEGTTGINVSGTSDLAPLEQQADMVKELLPDASTIGILYCSAEPNSAYQANEMQGYLEDAGYTVETFTVADTNEIASVTKNAVDKVDGLYIPTDNTIASATAAVNEITSAANIPVIAAEEGICRGTGVATLSISYYDLGVKTAEMAYEILVNKADPATMDVEFAEATTKEYVAERAEALGITIPDDYEAIEAEESE